MTKSFASRLKPTRDDATGIVEYRFDRIALNTPEDVEAFFSDFSMSLERQPQPLDVIVCLDSFTVAPAAREAYGMIRAKVAKGYYRHSARYAGPPQTRIATMTSAVRYHAEGLVYETREKAIAAILEARKKPARAKK